MKKNIPIQFNSIQFVIPALICMSQFSILKASSIYNKVFCNNLPDASSDSKFQV